MTFDPVRICAVLDEEGVDFVIVGGFAAVIHGSSLPTRDIDIVPARTDDNPTRLARALALPYLESLRDEIARERRAER